MCVSIFLKWYGNEEGRRRADVDSRYRLFLFSRFARFVSLNARCVDSFTGSCVSTKGGVALPLSSPSSAGKTSIGAVAAAAVAVGAAALLL